MAATRKKKTTRAADITRPEATIELGGQEYRLAYDMNAFRIAEDVYETQYKREANFGEILQQLVAGKLGAIMAIMYGALVSGGKEMAWSEFAGLFRLTSIPGMKEKMVEMLQKALPEVSEADAASPQ